MQSVAGQVILHSLSMNISRKSAKRCKKYKFTTHAQCFEIYCKNVIYNVRVHHEYTCADLQLTYADWVMSRDIGNNLIPVSFWMPVDRYFGKQAVCSD